MIDLEKAREFFKKYVANYDKTNGKVALKISHICRVAEISRNIAKELKLSQEDIELAELIGLLHDIGRFEQVRLYNTFVDRISINHGEYGVKVLFEDELIREFLEDTQYDEIIKKAILNHNRPCIEDGLTQREKVHAKIIRDADKTDILYTLTFEDLENSYGCKEMSEDEITPKILDEFYENNMVIYSDIKTNADMFVAHIAYIFDFNYNYGLKIVKEKNYIEKLTEKVNFLNDTTIESVRKVNEMAYQYIDQRLKEYN